MLNKFFISAACAAILLSGCGSSSGDTSLDTQTDITIERGPILGAYVIDNDGKRAFNLGDGNYRFQSTPSYPIIAYGGYIDVNRDNIIDTNDTELNIPLSLHDNSSKKLTIPTTIAQNEELKNELLTTYGLSEEELYNLTPSESIEISAISDEIFKFCIENNSIIEDINLTSLQSLESNIQTRIQQNIQLRLQHEISEIAMINEIELVKDLNITLDDANITQIQSDIEQSSTKYQDPSLIANLFPIYELTQQQKDDLSFMYQEEKVARDVYLNLYDIWGLKIFSNIAKAEQMHMDAVKALLEKYNLDVPVLSDNRGEFELEELQSLYDSLMRQSSTSSNEALIVGKLIEETDIADLEEKIVDTPNDIEAVYQNLLNGSYNHLNAFSKQIL